MVYGIKIPRILQWMRGFLFWADKFEYLSGQQTFLKCGDDVPAFMESYLIGIREKPQGFK